MLSCKFTQWLMLKVLKFYMLTMCSKDTRMFMCECFWFLLSMWSHIIVARGHRTLPRGCVWNIYKIKGYETLEVKIKGTKYCWSKLRGAKYCRPKLRGAKYFKGCEIYWAESKGYEIILRGAKFFWRKLRGLKNYWKQLRGLKILSNFRKSTPTGYPNLKMTRP